MVGASAARGQDPGIGFDTLALPGLDILHAPGGEVRALRLAEMMTPRPSLPALPPGFPESAEIWLAPDEETFSLLIGGAPPEWGAAVAIPARGAIVLPGFPTRRLPPDQLRQVLLHEWAHLGLHDYLGGLRVPRWFSEGYAEWSSGGWDFEEGWRLRLAIALNRAPPLDSLTLDWPRDRASAEVAYLLAGSAVAYLARSGGEDGLSLFLERWREDGGFETALRRTYGVTTGQFEEDWARHVRREYGWLFVITRSAVFWTLLGAALAGMFFVRRRHNRGRLARLRASEPPDVPEYWTGRERRSSPLWDQSVTHTTYGSGIRIEWRSPPTGDSSGGGEKPPSTTDGSDPAKE